ncbi:toprim domain-containing protein [Sinosporangium siamense]|uniref:DNA primase DNAG catalytic core N-terminal domain-containing protein n=1 Tax=Sinosporangium siamense TaxID=1367973 RepID=A0A919RQR0_9ACTN|nr:toprim domain-containing protein [Sinosporangium siamense]GII97542.1 hypothetical protein Ssi02_77730 [Sinosporangium siamense]
MHTGILREAERFFLSQVPGSWVPRYLAGRGFSVEVVQRWGIGYAPASWCGLTNHLRALGYSGRAVLDAGLARRSGRGTLIDAFRDRIMFPLRSSYGTVRAFIGHAVNQEPRYLASPTTTGRSCKDLLFGLHMVTRTTLPVLVEGPLDALAVSLAAPGRFAGIACLGARVSARQAESLTALGRARILIAFDGDQAGIMGMARAYPVLRPAALAIDAVTMPEGHDPASTRQQYGDAHLAGILLNRGRPLADLALDVVLTGSDLSFPETRLAALRRAAGVVCGLAPHDVARQVGRIARYLDLDHTVVTEAVHEAVAAVPVLRGRASHGTHTSALRPSA